MNTKPGSLKLSPLERKWLPVLPGLNGTFKRTGFEQGSYLFMMTWCTGILLILLGFAFREFRRTGWSDFQLMILVICLPLLVTLYFLVSRIGLRYEFSSGIVTAIDSWDRQLWSEDLTGLVGISILSGRGNMVLRLRWTDRKRSLFLFKSLDGALEGLAETAEQARAGPAATDPSEDSGPGWICPACHEENPATFEECWKCQRLRNPPVEKT